MAKTPAGTCPHCYADDLDYRATRCPNCGGSFGDSKRRRIIIRVIAAVIIIYLIWAFSTSLADASSFPLH